MLRQCLHYLRKVANAIAKAVTNLTVHHLFATEWLSGLLSNCLQHLWRVVKRLTRTDWVRASARACISLWTSEGSWIRGLSICIKWKLGSQCLRKWRWLSQCLCSVHSLICELMKASVPLHWFLFKQVKVTGSMPCIYKHFCVHTWRLLGQ